ncbi:MAG: asparagine synthase (glutamine-hydrolyzing), partial [Candidatus Bipolaricaulota bacterium]
MCGICGIFSAEISPKLRREAVERMCGAMVHRGPDDVGVREFGGACIGMRRLSIIDRSAQGHQPMPNEDESVWVVLNGEIYNFQSLRAELAERGHRFRSRADTEVILHLYEEHGEGCGNFLRGMFAFAVWDEPRRRLLLVRDRLGIKPVYYAEVPGGWVFASEIIALLASDLVGRDVDWDVLDQYLSFGYVPSPRTLLEGVHALSPGCRAAMGEDGLKVERWWRFPEAGSLPCPPGEVLPALRGVLEESIRLHQISDVPVGAFLSGGIDSTAVVGLMTQAMDRPVRTFSVGFDDAPEGYDEREYASEVARAFGADHTEVVVSGRTVRDSLPRIVRHIDQPSFDGINTFLISEAAKSGGVTVSLSGLGGDEVFGGYDTFHVIPKWEKASRLWGRMPPFLRRGVVRALRGIGGSGSLLSEERLGKLDRLRWVDSPIGLYGLARFTLWPDEKVALYGGGLLGHLHGHPNGEDPLGLLGGLVHSGASGWRLVSLLEMQTYMGWRLLRDTDAMSMAHSLEIRVPLIDHEVVEFVCGIPSGWERRWGHPKQLLVEALSDIIPPEVAFRRKQGFSFPMQKWMRQELRDIVEETLSPESVRRRGFFSPEGVQALYRRFKEGNCEY